MIPKIIHYCWFGKNKKPKKVRKYIKSWKKYCPDYEIKEWNEENFDIECCDYVKQAYENKKYAFVSDYARMYALYNEGGIYLDTDVELVQNLDEFLNNIFFIGFQDEEYINTGLIGSQKEHFLVKEMLEEYQKGKFILEDGSFNLTTNVVLITNKLKNRGLVKHQKQKMGEIMVYPKDYFCPLDFKSCIMNQTENTVAIHWFSGTWYTRKMKIKQYFTSILKKILGYENYKKLKRRFLK